MVPKLPSSIVAVAYTFIITVLAGVQFRRSRTPLRLGSFIMAFFGLSIAALSVVYAVDKLEMSIFWAYQFIAECIAVTWVITTIIHLGYAFYPLTRHQTLIWRVALGSVILYDIVAIAELAYYIYAVWGAGILSRSATPVVWVYWVRQVVKVIACLVTILYLFVPLVRHHRTAGFAQIADSNTLAVGAWYLGALGLVSVGYSTMLIYFICSPSSAFTLQAQSLDLCLRLLVCPIFSLPPPAILLRYFHDKYGSTNETDNPNTMVEAGITNDPRPRRPPMLVSQPASFTSNHHHHRRNSDFFLDSPSSLHFPPAPHQHSHAPYPPQQRYSISDYVPAFALKDSKLGATGVHLDPFRAASEDERRTGETGPSSIKSVAESTTLSSTGGDMVVRNASEAALTPTTLPTEHIDGAGTPSSDMEPKEKMAEEYEGSSNSSQGDMDECQQKEAIILSLSIPKPLAKSDPAPSEPVLSFGDGYLPPMADPKQEEAKQTAQAARRISRRLTMEGRREGMDLLHITSLIKWNNPSDSNNTAASTSRDRLHEIPAGWPGTGTTASSKPSTPLREYIPPIHKLSSFFYINKSQHSTQCLDLTLTEQQEEEEDDEVEVVVVQDHHRHPSRGRMYASDNINSDSNINSSNNSPATTATIIHSTVTATSTPYTSSTITAALEPAHNRDKLRRSQSLTRALPAVSPPSPSLSSAPFAPQEPCRQQDVSDRVVGTPSASPSIPSIPNFAASTHPLTIEEEGMEKKEQGVVDSHSSILPSTTTDWP